MDNKEERMKAYARIRERNIRIFHETQSLIKQTPDLKESVANAIENTEFVESAYVDKNLLKQIAKGRHEKMRGNIEVTRNKTIQEVLNRKFETPTAILNFASATNPGGGVKVGSSAQEEAICRETTLYQILVSDKLWEGYYKRNREYNNRKYLNLACMTDGVEILRDENDPELPFFNPEDRIKIGVCTCPAPNLRTDHNNINNPDSGETEALFLSAKNYHNFVRARVRTILSAMQGKYPNIILGAFGCGAFKNDPAVVADAFYDILIKDGYRDVFDNIIFAIYTNQYTKQNYYEFMKKFKGEDRPEVIVTQA